MKLLYCNEKIKFNLGQKVTEYEKIILCSDDEAPFLINAGYKEVSNLYDINALKTISDEVNNNISSFNEKVSNLENIATTMTENNSSLSELFSTYETKLNELQALITNIEEKYKNIETIYNKVISFNTDYKLKVEEFNNTIISLSNEKINDIDTFIALLSNEINKKVNEYNSSKNEYISEINALLLKAEEYVNTSQKYSETSKKWACNPVNVPVEDGLYSSLHYASIQNNKQ